MFLPEHRKQLLDQRQKQKRYIPSELDEQKLERMNQCLNHAMMDDRMVIVTFPGQFRPESFCGFIEQVDLNMGYIILEHESDRKKLILKEILDIEWA
ncbi:YolD-like family protein [Thermoactinomyces sp. DSM 45891]|uniref:YolD-like family protein n=1 Tax=Thermoactinomyces sp. DSM 45891 TaxID=1761907 RepID=UPI0015A6B6A8|nr:YolD-like family protein [Thermoactinomyces sp. DSM 45891]